MREGQKLKQARDLRRNATLPEQKLWQYLGNRQLDGFKFVRQMPIGPYIADFVCREKKLVVELDGWTHSTPGEISSDERRTQLLASKGYRVYRVGNQDVMESTEGVLQSILAELKK
jgi:very-short-patch-repair endonuclease